MFCVLFKEKTDMNILDAYQPQDVEYIIGEEKRKRILTERHGALPQEEKEIEN